MFWYVQVFAGEFNVAIVWPSCHKMRYEEFWGRPGLAPKQHRAEKITSDWNAKRVTWQESGRRPPPGVDLSSAFTVSDVIRHASKIGLAAWEGDESELRECCGAFIEFG